MIILKLKLLLIFVLLFIFHLLKKDILYYNINYCSIKKKNSNNLNAWNKGNYIDLGANNGDSVLWFFNLIIKNRKNSVLYPKINITIKKNFNTYIFEANLYLCGDIQNVTNYILRHSNLPCYSKLL